MLEPGAIPLAANVAPRRMHPRRPPAVQQQQSPHLVVLQRQLPLPQPLTDYSFTSAAESFCDLVQTSPERAASSLPSRSLNADSLPLFPDHCQLELLESSFACSTSTGPSEEQQKKNSKFSVNFGRAIRALREDIPSFFKREGDMSIYAQDMCFQDNISARLWSRKFDLRGVVDYRKHCQLMRTIFSFLFKHSDVSLPSPISCSSDGCKSCILPNPIRLRHKHWRMSSSRACITGHRWLVHPCCQSHLSLFVASKIP